MGRETAQHTHPPLIEENLRCSTGRECPVGEDVGLLQLRAVQEAESCDRVSLPR